MAEIHFAAITHAPHSELDDEALCWLAAEAGGEPPFSLVSHTRGSFRRAKLKSAFINAFIVTGILILWAIGYSIYTIVKFPWPDAAAKLHDAPVIALVLLGAHLVSTAVAFVIIGGLGGKDLDRPEGRMAVHATTGGLTLRDDAGRTETRPWSHWRIGSVGTIAVAEGMPRAVVRSLTLVPYDDLGQPRPAFTIPLDRLIGGRRGFGSILNHMLQHAR